MSYVLVRPGWVDCGAVRSVFDVLLFPRFVLCKEVGKCNLVYVTGGGLGYVGYCFVSCGFFGFVGLGPSLVVWSFGRGRVGPYFCYGAAEGLVWVSGSV